MFLQNGARAPATPRRTKGYTALPEFSCEVIVNTGSVLSASPACGTSLSLAVHMRLSARHRVSMKIYDVGGANTGSGPRKVRDDLCDVTTT
ncbi:hypothetical protein BaRGS_00012397 [Batillaria attramentaria]|uniref:Uncharacterized protein n=1 Tax=Batillaria attramentaria TaxID=370345 RepID=A0ABD0LAT1_9CAEN